ncbi:SMI1/KNR4 family protein [Lysobacter sp. TAF61]|uniref:SMI1/KNR4 family protein n=1 Tax=Lysobacter sp. TAF61 TaxID=3233072 RepID=UPI003F95A1D6
MKHPAPTQDEVAEVEKVVGFPLPPALVALYALRGNGGFGPDYGLLGLSSGHVTDQGDTALSLYRVLNSSDPDDPGWVWRRHLLPILHLGCAIHYCIDLATPGNPVVQFDPNAFGPGDDWSGAFTVAFPKLGPWLGGL